MYRWTQKYVGIPFISGGRDKTGLDCYGLVRLVLQDEYGYVLPLLSGSYASALNMRETKKIFMTHAPVLCGENIPCPEEEAVALIKTRGQLSHVALYAGDDFIIHALNKTGVVCERIAQLCIAGRIEGWYRVNKSCRAAQSVLV